MISTRTNANGHTRTARNRKAPLSTVSDGTANNGHDEKGRFTKGNTEARGNPFARRMAKLRSIVLDAVSEGDLRAIIGTMVELARDSGDVAAAKLLLAYLIGRPAEAVDPDRLDLEEFRLLDESPTPAQVMRLRLDGLPPAVVLEHFRELRPKTTDDVNAKLEPSLDLAKQVLAEQQTRIGR